MPSDSASPTDNRGGQRRGFKPKPGAGTAADQRARMEQAQEERKRREIAMVEQNRLRKQEAQAQARWVVPKPKKLDPGSRPTSAGVAYASSRSRSDVEAARAARRRPQSAGSVASAGLGQPGRRTTEFGNFIATGLLNLDNLQIKKSKTAPEWMAKRLKPGAHAGRDGYVAHPKFKTRSEMNKAREDSFQADPTFDIDGDGTVSNEDFLLASRFDVDKDGTIDPDERIDLRVAMVQDTVNKFREFQAAGQVGFDPEVEELMEAFTDNLDETIHSSQFGSLLQKLMVKTNVTNTANSINIHKIMQQPRKGAAMADFMDADDDGDGLISKEEILEWKEQQRNLKAQRSAEKAKKMHRKTYGTSASPPGYMGHTMSSARSHQSASSEPLSFAESDLDTVREFDELGRDPNHTSGFATRSSLFEHRRASDREKAQRRIDYHMWGGDYTFPADPAEQRATTKNLRRTFSGDRGWWVQGMADERANGEGHTILHDAKADRRQSTEPKPVQTVPIEVWTGIECAPTWKPSTVDPSGRTPTDLKNVHPTLKPHGSARLAQRRKRNVKGMGTHLSIACGENTARKEKHAIDYKKQNEQLAPEMFFNDVTVKTFGETDSKNHRILQKVLANANKRVE
jgi:Ca2+-binding EF-hand superfamily protein